MSGVERRRLFCAILFHFAAALCVIWSLCVLIERATEEVRKGQIGWPFWTKLVVVTVGLTGGVVFMYIQCKQYLQLCGRWRARNRILLIQNAPEKIHIAHSPTLPQRCYGNSAAAGSISINSASLYRNIDFYDGAAQAQVLANIEQCQSSAMNSERDFILDDASQLSFKPLRQGSGSINNMFDQRTNKSACSDSTTSNPIIQQEQRSVGSVFKVRCLESAVFLENADILNTNSDRKYYRHSSVLLLPADTEKLDMQPSLHDARRYSDTKLLQRFNPAALHQRLDEFLGQQVRHETHSADALSTATANHPPSAKPIKSQAVTTTSPPQLTDLSHARQSSLENLSNNNQQQLQHHQSPIRDTSRPVEPLHPHGDVFKSLPNLIADSTTTTTTSPNQS